MSFMYYLCLTLFMVVSFMLCAVILMQESKSSGLGSSFGGDATSSMFGTGTADVLKQFTAYLAALFFIACILLSIWTTTLGRTQSSGSTVLEQIRQEQN